MSSIRDMLAWAVDWAGRANVGYSQTYRTMQTYNGITYFDCSSFTFFAMWLGGAFDLSQFGFSTNLSDYSSYANNITPQAGDIVVKTAQHCEIVYDTNPLQLVGARNSSLPLADQVAIHQVSSLSWYDEIWRYGGGPDPPTPPGLPVPIWLLKRAAERSGLFGTAF